MERSRYAKKYVSNHPIQVKLQHTPHHKELEEAVLIWFKQQLSNLLINDPILYKNVYTNIKN